MNTKSVKTLARLLAATAILVAGLGTGSNRAVDARQTPINTRVSHDRFPAHVEPFLAINPRNHNNLLAVSQLIVPDRFDTIGSYVSFDAGRSWHDNGPLRLPRGRTSATDVTATFDARGIAYACATAIGGSGSNRRGVYVWQSGNGGRSFLTPVPVIQGNDIDHPWIASSGSHSRLLYVAWGSANGLGFSRSADGGRTFSRPRLINGGGDSEVPAVAAGPHGVVYVTYEAGDGGTTGLVDVVASRDGGLHFGRPDVLGSAPPEILVNPNLRLPTSPAVAADQSTGAAYVAFAAHLKNSARSNILIARTQDQGRSWHMIGRATRAVHSANRYDFQPQLAVDSHGGVDVSYFALLRKNVNLYLLHAATLSGHLTFGPPQQITSSPFNPNLGLPHSKHGRWWIGDYQGLATTGERVHLVWNDTRPGHLEIFTASVALPPHARTLGFATVSSQFPDIQISHDSYPAHAEPSLAVNPRNPRNLLGSAMFLGHGVVRVGTFSSLNSGRSWTDNGPLPSPRGMSWTGDTTAAFNRRGVGFISAAVTSFGNGTKTTPANSGVYVWRTLDGGRTFRRPVAVARGVAVDHPGMAIAPDTGTIYLAWRNKSPAGLAFSRSTDGGQHFEHLRLVLKTTQTLTSVPIVAAGPRGEVAIAYELDYGQPWSLIQVFVSSNGGRTFTRATVARASLTVTPAPDILMPSPVCIAIDPHDGSIDVVYSAYQRGARNPAVVVAGSVNRGRDWERPVTVKAGGGPASAFQPRIAVDGSGGVDVTYFALTRGRVNLFVSRSASRPLHFAARRRVTTRSFDPNLGIREGGKTGAWWIGDYQGLAAGTTTIFPIWNDTRSGRLQIFTATIPTSVSNVQVTHDRYAAHVEPTVAVNPLDPGDVVAAALLLPRSGSPRIGTFLSLDAGTTWKDSGPLPLPEGTDSSDVPDVAFDARDHVDVAGIAENAGELDFGNDQRTCVCLWQSVNGGRSFGRPLTIERGRAVDHPSIATSNSGRVIDVAWRSKQPDGIAFSRSLDGGHSFTRPRIIARMSGGETFAPAIAAGLHRRLAIAYIGQRRRAARGKQASQTGAPGMVQIEIVTSTDGGATFSRSRQLAGAPEALAPNKPMTLLSLPSLAMNRSGNSMFVAYMTGSPRATGIALSHSSDGGHTWAATTIAGPARSHGRSYFQPAVAVDDAGNVGVSYLSLANHRVDVWLARSTTGGKSFASARRITTRSFNLALGLNRGGPNGSWWIGDYQGFAAGGRSFHPMWGDTRTGRLQLFTAQVPNSGES